MKIEFVRASEKDAKKFVEIQDKAFNSDYIKYGVCPGYGRNIESIAESMKSNITFKIVIDGEVIGKVSANKNEYDECHLDCLCIIPEYENKGIGQKAVAFIEKQFNDAKKWLLETPLDKLRNHYFYQKCGYTIIDKIMEGNVELVIFEKEIK